MNGRVLLKELTMEIGFLAMVAGIILLVFTTMSLFYYKETPQIIIDIVKPLHDTHWDMWGFFFGILLVIIGAQK